MEKMVDILGLVVKIDIVLTEGILTKTFEESKINEVKIVEPKSKVDKNCVLTIEIFPKDSVTTEMLSKHC